MKNFVQDGDTLDLVAPYDVLSGAGFQINDIFAVAVTDALNTKPVEGKITGVFDLKYGVNTALANVGVKIYWDNGAKNVTSAAAAGANLLIGYLVKAAAANDATIRVKLLPAA